MLATGLVNSTGKSLIVNPGRLCLGSIQTFNTRGLLLSPKQALCMSMFTLPQPRVSFCRIHKWHCSICTSPRHIPVTLLTLQINYLDVDSSRLFCWPAHVRDRKVYRIARLPPLFNNHLLSWSSRVTMKKLLRNFHKSVFFFSNLLLAKNQSKLFLCADSKKTIDFTFKIYLMRIKFLASWWKQNNSNEKQRWVKPDNMFWFISVKYFAKKSRLVQNNRGRSLKGNTFFQYYVKKSPTVFCVREVVF